MAEGVQPEARRGSAAPGRRDAILLAVLCALTLAYWSLQYRPFVLPNNDYYSFEGEARSVAALELPREFKRLPAFPAVMAVLASLVPGATPYLDAALLANLAFAATTLVLLFVYARRAFGEGALLVPLLFATSVQLHAMALQPLVEPSLGFFVVLTCVLHQRRSAWQYAAGFAVGLGRVEAATLVPLLFLLNWREDGRFWRHALLGGLASAGLLAWTGLGAVFGRGQNFYLELMEGTGWQPAPGFYLRVLRESFAFLDTGHLGLLLPLLALAALPVAVGIAGGLRRFRRESLLLLLFFGVSTSVVAVFGVNKARYAYPVLWIPLFFCAHGLVRLRDGLCERLAPRLGAARWPLVLGGGVWLACLGAGLARLLARPSVLPPALDAGFVLACVGLAAVSLLAGARPPRTLRRALACGVLAFASAAMAGGIAGKRTELLDVHYANYGSYVLAEWLRENLGPDDRIVVLGKKHIQHLTGIPRDRLVTFSKTDAEDVAGLAAFMREGGWTLVAWTHRGEVNDPAEAWYHQRLRVGVAEPFRDGGPVPGFEHVATLRVPVEAEESDVQIYRLRP